MGNYYSASDQKYYKGGSWKGQVYFASESGFSTEQYNAINDDELKQIMERNTDDREEIESVWVYKCKLSSLQLTMVVLNHQFIVLRTNRYWWSIEKNDEGITIQRSQKMCYVKDYYRKEKRSRPIQEIYHAYSKKTMKDVIEILWYQNELPTKYHWLTQNCQHFAARISKAVSEPDPDYIPSLMDKPRLCIDRMITN